MQEIRRLFPLEPEALYDEALNRDGMGQHEEAVRLWQQYCTRAEAYARKSKTPSNRLNIAVAMVRMGRRKEATGILNAALKAQPKSGFDAATVLALLDRRDEAVDQLQNSINAGYDNFIWMKIHPDLSPLHGFPRFEQLFTGKLKT